MSDPTMLQRFRAWLAFTVLLRVLWFVAGEKPLFCDLAADKACPLNTPACWDVEEDDE